MRGKPENLASFLGRSRPEFAVPLVSELLSLPVCHLFDLNLSLVLSHIEFGV